jgi:hypothetical protein
MWTESSDAYDQIRDGARVVDGHRVAAFATDPKTGGPGTLAVAGVGAVLPQLLSMIRHEAKR